jgi:uncharacterized protein (TIGR03083 family)
MTEAGSTSRTREDVDTRVRAERERLIAVLEGLSEVQWDTPSLCAGWTVRNVVVHLLMPYELSVPRFLVLLARSRFSFDRLADRFATTDRRSTAELLAALRATEGRVFNVPGAPVEAPLSHLVCHAEDVYRPLGIASPTELGNVVIVLDELTRPGSPANFVPGLRDGLAFSATDTQWRTGEGLEVSGPAAALMTTVIGRTAALGELSGDGVAVLQARLHANRAGA